MARALTTKVNLQIDATLSNLVGLASVTGPISRGLQSLLASGTGAGQADWIFSETNTIAASGNKDYDLAGVLTDIFGAVITFARIKTIALFADAGNTNNVIVGAAAATIFFGPFGANTHTVNVRPGGMLLMHATDVTAWPVGAGATDLLRIANSAAGTSVLYDLILIGSSV